MSMPLTLILLGLSLLTAFICGWRGSRPINLQKGPRMVPWSFIMLVSASLAFLLMIHVFTLISGRTFPVM